MPSFNKKGCEVSTGLFWRQSGSEINLSARPDIADGYECYAYCIVQKDSKEVKIKSPDGGSGDVGLSLGWKITSVCSGSLNLHITIYDIVGAYGDLCGMLRVL